MNSEIFCYNCSYLDKYLFAEKYFLTINNHPIVLDEAEFYSEDKFIIYSLFHDLLNDIKHYKKFNSKSVSFVYSKKNKIQCPNVNKVCINNNYFSLADEFKFFIENYSKYKLNEILKKELRISLEDSQLDEDYLWWQFINKLPIKYFNEKRFLKKINKISSELPTVYDKGGGEEIIQWIFNETLVSLWGLIITSATTFGISKTIQFIKNRKCKKLIQKKIKEHSESWDDISFEDLERYISIPKDFKGSKEELIEKIISSKIIDYKKTLIEKIRKQL